MKHLPYSTPGGVRRHRATAGRLLGHVATITMVVASLFPLGFPGGIPQAEAANVDICYSVADLGDRLITIDRIPGTFTQAPNQVGVPNIEAISFDITNSILYATNDGELGVINTTTGIYSPIGATGQADVDGLAIDPFTGILYGAARVGGDDRLITINPSTGASVVIGTVTGPGVLGDIDDLGVDPFDGTLFGIANNGGSGDQLVRINKATGAATVVGALGVSDMEGLSVDTAATIRGTTGGTARYYVINKTTGAATFVSNLGGTGLGDFESLACVTGSDLNTITGRVYYDANSDAVFNAGDTGYPGAVVRIYRDVNGDGLYDAGDVLVATETTGAGGTYTWQGSTTGKFVMTVNPTSLPSGATFTTDNLEAADFGTAFGLTDPNNDFGFTAPPRLTITKNASPAGPVAAGDTVTYTIVVTNSGSTTQQQITVTDPQPTGVTWLSTSVDAPPPGSPVPGGAMPNLVTSGDGYSLNPGQSMTVVVQVSVNSNLSSGINQISNVVSTTSLQQPWPSSASANTPLDLDEGVLTVVKSGPASTQHGSVVAYTFDVTYAPGPDGSPAQNIAVSDPRCDAAPAYASGDANSNGYLDGGETWRYTCSFTVPAYVDGEPDPIPNTATVTGQDRNGDAVTGDTDDHAVDLDYAEGTLAITKTGPAFTQHGGTVTYTMDVTYSSTDGSPAQAVSVTDPVCDSAPVYVSGDTDGDSRLDVSETWRYTCDLTVPAHGGGEADPVLNTAQVDATNLDGSALAPATDGHSVDIAHPDLSIAKTVFQGHDAGASCPGGELVTNLNATAITYCFVVTNTGDTHLDGLTITDTDLGITEGDMTLSAGTFPLAPASTATYYYETAIAGDLTNTAVAVANPTTAGGADLAGVPDASDSDTAQVEEVAPAVTVDKTVYRNHTSGAGCPGGELVSQRAGAAVTFCFTVTNTGDTHLDTITLDDADLGISEADMTLLSGTFPLAPAASATYYYESNVAGDLVNTVDVAANPTTAGGSDLVGVANVTDSDTAEIDEVAPSVAIDKTLYQGHDSGASCTGSDAVAAVGGAPITYCFEVTNTGDTYLALLTLSDANLGINEADMTLASGVFPLAPAATALYYYETNVAGDLVNSALVLANPVDSLGNDLPGLANVGDSDTANLDEVAPAVTIAKTVYQGHDSGTSCSGGELIMDVATAPITYCFTVTNTGDTNLDPVTITDTDLGITDADMTLAAGTFPLVPLASATWFYETTVVADLVNTASVSANPADGAGADLPGLLNVTDSDTAEVDRVAPAATVDKTVYQGHDGGASCPGGELVSDLAGTDVTFCFVVANGGDTYLDVALTDADLGITEADMTLVSGALPLAPAGSIVFTYETVVSGDLVNTADLVANPVDSLGNDLPGIADVDDSDTAAVDEVSPAATIAKTVYRGHDSGASCAGGELVTDVAAAAITFCFAVSNTGDTDLAVSLDDADLGISEVDMTLASGVNPVPAGGSAVWFYEASVAGDLVNTVNMAANPVDALGNDLVGLADITGSDTAEVDEVAPAASIDKTVYAGHDLGGGCPGGELIAGEAADPVTYCFVVVNTGDTGLDVSLADADLGITDAAMTVVSGVNPVPAGGTTVWFYEAVVAGDLVNTVDMTANPVDGLGNDLAGLANVVDDDTAEVHETAASVTIAKTVYQGHDGGVSCAGGELVTDVAGTAVTYCFLVTNTGDTHLDAVAVADADLGITDADMTLASGVFPLAPAASAVWYFESLVAGDLVNTADVSANPVDALGNDLPGLADVADSDTAEVDEVAPSGTVAKTVYRNHSAGVGCPGGELVTRIAGAAITFCFTVTNTGDTDLDVALSDSDLGITDADMTLLSGVNPVPVGGTAVWFYETVVAGDLVNTVDLAANPVDGVGNDLPGLVDVTDSDTAEVDEVAPAGTVAKTVYQGHDAGATCAGGELVTDVAGAAVTYCFAVANTGDTDLDVALSDAALAIVDGDMTLLSGSDPVPVGGTTVWFYETTIAGDLTNTVNLVANPVDGLGNDLPGVPNVTRSDTAAVDEVAPGGSVAKSVYQGHDSGVSCAGGELVADVAGEPITFCFVVTNTGDTDLDVALDDADLGITDADMTLLSGANPVPVGGTAVWFYETTVTGDLVNTVDMAGNPVDGLGNDLPGLSDATDSDTAEVDRIGPDAVVDKTVYAGHDAGLTCPAGNFIAAVAGSSITYCFTVTNTGDTDLDASLTDADLGITDADMTLLTGANPVPVGGTIVWFYETTVAGDLLNTVDLAANPVDGLGNDLPGLSDVTDSDTAQVDEVAPAATVAKTVYAGHNAGVSCTGGELVTETAGAAMTYCFGVANTGDTALDVALDDADLGITDADMTLLSGANPVPVGGTTVWFYETVVAGDLLNTVDLAANPVDGLGNDLPGLADVTGSDTAEVDEVAPSGTVGKTVYAGHDSGVLCAGGELVTQAAGAPITYCFSVTNTGDTDLDVALSDGDLGITDADMTLLSGANPVPVGGTTVWFYETVVAGDLLNTVDLAANPVDGLGNDLPGLSDVTDSDTAQVDEVAPAATVAKTVYAGHDAGATCPGGELVTQVSGAAVTYCFIVDNTGDTDLDVSLTDADLGITTADLTLLSGANPVPIGTEAIWFYETTITGDLTNTVDMAGNPVDGLGNDLPGLTDVTDSDTAAVDEVAPASIGDLVWLDLDRNDLADIGEPGIEGLTVNLYAADGTTLLATTTTDAGGTYRFDGLLPGVNYVVEIEPPAGGTFVAANAGADDVDSDVNATTGRVTVNPVSGDNFDVADAGMVPGSIGDVIWLDTDLDATQDLAEPAIAGITVNLYASDGTTLLDSAVTDGAGAYRFDGLVPGDGFVVAVDYPEATFVAADAAADAIDSDVDGSGRVAVTAASGFNGDVADAGVIPATLGDRVWLDANANGTIGASETTGIAGAIVNVYDPADLVTPLTSTVTDGLGNWLINDVRPGAVVVEVVAPPPPVTAPFPYDFSPQDVGSNEAIDSDFDPTTGLVTVTVVSGDNLDIDAGLFLPIVISDFVWLDLDGDGIQDPGEPGMEGLTVNLYESGLLIETTLTDADGLYGFDELDPGTYTVEVIPPIGGAFSSADQGGDDTIDSDFDGTGRVTVTVAAGADITIDAGIIPTTIGDLVWLDVDGDGVQGGAEPGVPGVTVNLYAVSDLVTPLETTTTDADGIYHFYQIPGDYVVEVVAPAGATIVPQGAGSDPALDSDVDPSTGRTGTINAPTGLFIDDADAGLVPASLGDFVWLDLDGDGLFDAGEPGVAGVAVDLYAADGTTLLGSTVTNGSGGYTFAGLMPGVAYVVDVSAPAGAVFTAADAGIDDTIDSDVDPTTGRITATIPSGTNGQVADAGFLPGSLGDFVWLDLDSDGLQDAGEPGLDGVVVDLYAADGSTLLASTTTDAFGRYTFGALVPGEDYVVAVVLPAGAVLSSADIGTDDTVDSDVDPTTARVTVGAVSGADLDGADAGVLPGVIAGAVYFDLDGDGIFDPTETGMAGVVVELLDGSGTVVDAATVAADGAYLFTGLPPDGYTVAIDPTTLPASVAQTGDPDPTLDGQTSVVLGLSESIAGIDFGYQPPAVVTGLIWLDTDGDGVVDSGEPPLAGVDVTITDANGNTSTVTTDASGIYTASVDPGVASISVDAATLPSGVVLTTANDVQTIDAAAGEVTTAESIGYQPGSGQTVSGSVVYDVAGDGSIGTGDPGLAGISVDLLDATGTVVATTVTDADGLFVFEDVAPGDYDVMVDSSTLPAGLDLATVDPDGTLDDATPVLVEAGTDVAGLDFAYSGSGSASGLLWKDIDADNAPDGSEPRFGGIPVTLTWAGPDGLPGTADDVVFSTTTAPDGTYAFGDLPAGSYTIAVDETALPVGHANTFAAATSFTLGAGEDRTGLDFGYRPVVDLQVTITPDVTTVAVGDIVEWSVVVTNHGPAADPGRIVVTLQIPPTLRFVGIDHPDWTYEVLGDMVIATYAGELGVGEVIGFTMLTEVLAVGVEITIPASVLGAGLDVNVGNNASVGSIGTLPRTGASSDRLAPIGGFLLALGLVLVAATRRRRRETVL